MVFIVEMAHGVPETEGFCSFDAHGSVVHLLHGLHQVGVAHLACLRRGNRASDVG